MKLGASVPAADSLRRLAALFGRACCGALTGLTFTRQVHEYLEKGAKEALLWSRGALRARQNRYERYLSEVRSWHELPGGSIKLAHPVPMRPGVWGKVPAPKAKPRAAARPTSATAAEGPGNAAPTDNAPSGGP